MYFTLNSLIAAYQRNIIEISGIHNVQHLRMNKHQIVLEESDGDEGLEINQLRKERTSGNNQLKLNVNFGLLKK